MARRETILISNPPKIRDRIRIVGWYERKWLDQGDGRCYKTREGSHCLFLAGHDGDCFFDPKPALGESK